MLDTEKAMQKKVIRDELKMLAQTIKRIKARQAKLRALLKDDTK
jgi:prefoldin subunit 5